MIELRNLTKRFGNVTAVDNVSLSVKRGEFLTLLGPSGCGKTTLLRTISGFESPNSGAVLLDDHDVTGLPPYHRDVNQVFQSYALFPHLNVWKNVAFGLRVKKVPRVEIDRSVAGVLAMVELTGLEKRKPHQLSGGQKQRVALARAIVNKPKILLLDEPLAALDAKLRHMMQFELKSLQQRLGITFVYVTHDQAEALAMSDRIAVMNAGKIEQLAPPQEIYSRPATEFVARFVGLSNVWTAEVLSGDGRIRIGDIELPLPQASAAKAQVMVLVRPEHVAVDKPGGVQAVVSDVSFTGPITHLRLTTRAGVDVQAIASRPDLRKGQSVTISIDPQAIVLIG